MIDNNKLAKELASIYSSSNKAKKSVTAELAKIDEKYRKLAEQEKEQLNKTLEMLDAQLKYYGALLNLDSTPVEEKVEETVVEEKEDIIEDTIFPENNEEAKEESVEEVVEKAEELEDLPEETVEEPAKDEFSDIWPEESEETEKTEENNSEEEEDEWPEMPEEWK